jgi:hypothetical protein
VINKFNKNCNILSYARGAYGELKLASFCSSGVLFAAPGRLDLVHPHALGGVHSMPPPPPEAHLAKKVKKYHFFHKNIIIFSLKKRRISTYAGIAVFLYTSNKREFKDETQIVNYRHNGDNRVFFYHL